jgi:hypothetical protein
MKAPGVTHAKRLRVLMESHADRQKKHDARLGLRKRIRDHGIAQTARMDRERLSNMRADVPLTARSAQQMMPPRTSTPRPMRVDLSPRSTRTARSVSSAGTMSSGSAMSVGSRAGSVSSLVAKFSGLGYPGGVPPVKRPARMQKDLSNYKR